MKFRRPTAPGDVDAPRSSGSFVGKPNLRPDWLKDWIDNKAKYVLLACGHKVDLKWRGQITLEGLDEEKGIFTNCQQCDRFSAIERGMSFSEYHGKPTAVIPDEPLF